MSDDPIKSTEGGGISLQNVDDLSDTLEARRALDELLRRHPDWDRNPPCPNCGSRDHFECDGSGIA